MGRFDPWSWQVNAYWLSRLPPTAKGRAATWPKEKRLLASPPQERRARGLPPPHVVGHHVPGGAYYDITNLEACFATEADAQAAGYRASER